MFEAQSTATDVYLRILRPEDSTMLADAYQRNREHLAPWEPTRTDEFFTEHFQREDIERRLAACASEESFPLVLIDSRYRDPRVWTHLPSGRHSDLDTTASMVTSWIEAWQRDGLAAWIVRDARSGDVRGHVGCAIRRDAFWNLGYRLAVEAQGRGIARRVSAAAVRRARLVDPSLPVVAYLLEHNRASAHVAERCGLTLRHRAPDAGNPDPEAVRLVYADRVLSDEQLHAALA